MKLPTALVNLANAALFGSESLKSTCTYSSNWSPDSKNSSDGLPNSASANSCLVTLFDKSFANANVLSLSAKAAGPKPIVARRSINAASNVSSSASGPQMFSLKMSRRDGPAPEKCPGRPIKRSPPVSSALQTALVKISHSLAIIWLTTMSIIMPARKRATTNKGRKRSLMLSFISSGWLSVGNSISFTFLQNSKSIDLKKSFILGWNIGGFGHANGVNDIISLINGEPGKALSSSIIKIKLSEYTSISASI